MRPTKAEKKILNALLHEILLKRDKVCLRCGNPKFQASHIYNKGRYRGMEFDPDNLKALCFACHLGWWHKNSPDTHEWLAKTIPKARLDRLKLLSKQTIRGFDPKLHILYLRSLIKKM